MIDKKSINYFYLIIFLGIFLFYIKNNTLKENIVLKNSVMDILNSSTEIDFSKIYGHFWDKLYIIPPYSDMNDILSKYKLSKKTKLNSNIDICDSINLLLFVESNKIVSFLELPREIGFSYLTSPIELDKIDTKFKIDKNTIAY